MQKKRRKDNKLPDGWEIFNAFEDADVTVLNNKIYSTAGELGGIVYIVCGTATHTTQGPNGLFATNQTPSWQQ